MRGRAVARTKLRIVIDDSGGGGEVNNDYVVAAGSSVGQSLVDLVKNSNSGVYFGRVIRKVNPYRVGLIHKRSIFGLHSTPNW